jgi:hypothetical protein
MTLLQWIAWYIWQIPFLPLRFILGISDAMLLIPGEDMAVLSCCLATGTLEIVDWLAGYREQLFVAVGGVIPGRETA